MRLVIILYVTDWEAQSFDPRSLSHCTCIIFPSDNCFQHCCRDRMALKSFEHLSVWSDAVGNRQPSHELYHLLFVLLKHFSLTLRIRPFHRVMTMYNELVRRPLSKISFWHTMGIKTACWWLGGSNSNTKSKTKLKYHIYQFFVYYVPNTAGNILHM